MQFEELIQRAKKIKSDYAFLNRTEGGNNWGVDEYAKGFVGDVGDLMKLLMAKKGFRFYDEDIDAKLRHEIADCLYSIIAISAELNIDLEQAFMDTMKEIEGKIGDRNVLPDKNNA